MNRNRNTVGRATFVALLFLFTSSAIADTFDIRALWVVRDHIISKEKIDEVVEFAKMNNYVGYAISLHPSPVASTNLRVRAIGMSLNCVSPTETLN